MIGLEQTFTRCVWEWLERSRAVRNTLLSLLEECGGDRRKVARELERWLTDWDVAVSEARDLTPLYFGLVVRAFDSVDWDWLAGKVMEEIGA